MVLAFLGISVVVIVTPGEDTALTIRNARACAFAVAKAGDVLRRRSVRAVFDALLGAVLTGLGIRLAADR